MGGFRGGGGKLDFLYAFIEKKGKWMPPQSHYVYLHFNITYIIIHLSKIQFEDKRKSS